MSSSRFLFAAVLALAVVATALAADVTGKWTASFDTPIGVQNYTYTFKVDGGKLTGTAKSQFSDVEIQEGKVSGDDISFVENTKFEDQPLRIEYKGKVSGDEIKFTRKVADFATEELVAKRVK
jgi:opacity protein-like surface antigen